MTCHFCGEALKGFLDAQLVTLNRKNYIRCADVDACNARANERERRIAAGQPCE